MVTNDRTTANITKRIFREVARLAWNGKLEEKMELLPETLSPGLCRSSAVASTASVRSSATVCAWRAACVRERAAGRASGKAVCPERRSSFPPGPGAPRSFSFDPETRMKTSWEGGGRRSGHHRKLNTSHTSQPKTARISLKIL